MSKTTNCLAGCISEYAVGPNKRKFLLSEGGQAALDSYNVAPFVKIKLLGNNGKEITVGNRSLPSDGNTAVIKSIEYGFVDSNEGKVEIIDEKGGELTAFLNSIQKCTTNFSVGSQIEYQIGWVYTQCGSHTGYMDASPWLRGIVLKVSTNLSNGVIKFTVHFATSHAVTQNLRQDQIFGEEIGGKTMELEQAITQLAAKEPAINVRYGYYNQSGELIYVEKHKWVTGTPKAAWHGDSQNKYSTISKWLEGFIIDDGRGKGAVLVHDPSKPSDLLVLRDPQPSAGESYIKELNLGTFIVNGGKCSNVLEFSPSFDFVSAMAHFSSGGSTQGAISTAPVKKDDVKPIEESCQTKDTGKQQSQQPNQAVHFHEGTNAPDQINKSQIVQEKAARLVSIAGNPVEAELRLIGVTDRDFHSIIQGKTCSIIVVSPFYIQNTKGGECGDFLKKADCHPVFSNSCWVVLGVNHAVQEGSFVTTLKVMLASPGIQIEPGGRMGASPNGYQIAVQ